MPLTAGIGNIKRSAMLNLESLNRFRDFKFQILQLIPEWARAYEVPEQEIMRQINEAHAWANANPSRAPKKLPVRFLHSWMRKAKQMGSLKKVVVSDRRYREDKPPEEELPGP